MGKIKDHPIWSKVIGSVLFAFIGGLALYFVPGGWPWVFDKVGSGLKWLMHWLASPATIPTWLLAIFIAITALVLIVVAWGLFLMLVTDKKDPLNLSRNGDYCANGIKFLYRYDGHQAKIITLLCQTCDFEIVPQNSHTFDQWRYQSTFICERCEQKLYVYSGKLQAYYDFIERCIEHEIRTASKLSV